MTFRKAVVVEDTAGDRELISGLLRAAGFEQVQEYPALPRAFDPPLDEDTLLVLDLVLGAGADGVQALQALAGTGLHSTPIIIVSGQLRQLLGVVETYGKALGLNVVATAEKPIEPDLFKSLQLRLNGSGHA